MIIIKPQEITVVSTNVTNGTEDYMFDEYLNRQTSNADLIEVQIAFNNADRVALFNLEATSIVLQLTDNATSEVVQTKTIDLEMIDGEYQQWVIDSAYIYADATMKISIHNAGSDAKCGKCGIGLSTNIGQTQYGAQAGFIDYSIKDINEFGQTYLNPGNWAKNPSITTVIDYDIIDEVFEDLADVRGKLVFFEGNEQDSNFESFRALGFIEDWRITVNNPSIAWVDLSLQGVI